MYLVPVSSTQLVETSHFICKGRGSNPENSPLIYLKGEATPLLDQFFL